MFVPQNNNSEVCPFPLYIAAWKHAAMEICLLRVNWKVVILDQFSRRSYIIYLGIFFFLFFNILGENGTPATPIVLIAVKRKVGKEEVESALWNWAQV